ncbi:MAG TPA: hypothetical protein VHK90_05475, partial [Thermoanaerobaculia bacterium]|nr:hypothetical protein [Thermoanaerobaculia bacterium]
MAPARSDFQKERALAQINLGSFAESQNELDRAIRHYEVALAVMRQRAQREPSNTEVLSDLQAPLNKIAWAEFKTGRFEAARRHYEEERRILLSLLEREPQHEFRRQRLAINHDYLGTVRMAMGDIDGALAEFESDIALQERAVKRDPANMIWRRNLAAAYRQHGDTLRARDPGRAMASYAKAANTIASVLAKQKGEMQPALELGMIEIGMARTLLRQEKLGGARMHAERAVEALAALKGGADKQRRHALALVTLGEIHAAAGRTDQARERWLEAERVLPPRSPSLRDPRILDMWARVLLLLDRDAEAQPVLADLDAMGYRSPDLDALRQS